MKKKIKMKKTQELPFRKYFYDCECNGEGLITDEDEDSIFISLWKLGFGTGKKLCLKERLRWCLNVLRTGHPWTDEVILSPKTALELSEDLFSRGVRIQQTSSLNKKEKKNVKKTKN